MVMRMTRIVAALLATLASFVLAAPAVAIDRFSPLDVTTLGHLQPVKGSDGRQHLVYELRIQNLSAELGVVIERVEARAARSGRAIAELSGDSLLADLELAGDPFARTPTTTLAPGQSAVLWMQPTFARRADVPAALRHVITLAPAPDSDASAFALRYDRRVVTDPVPVDRRPPLVVGAPARGSGFVAFNGCCRSLGHRRTALAVDGRLRVAERFAIDWMKADRQGRLWRGDGSRNEQYFVYGVPIRAVADGRVVVAVDRYEDTPPLQRSTDTVSPTTAAGNHVIVDFGHGRYGLYAHIKPGTVKVRRGDRVKAGQVIGEVGSSGNSDAPHLHFHLTDRPSPLAADGLPYVHRRFALEGRAVDDELVFRERPRELRDALPLDMTVVRFP